jgi:hypothetical protein
LFRESVGELTEANFKVIDMNRGAADTLPVSDEFSHSFS